ncbi:MAG: zinc-regulated TonB-dependent outer membrane receptor [Kofleriaceae bacterium]
MSRLGAPRLAVIAAVFGAARVAAWAQAPAPEPADAGSAAAGSGSAAGSDDLSDIQSALASDAAAQAKQAPAPAPSSGGGIQSMNPDISLIADFALATFSDPDAAAALQAGDHDPHENGFSLQGLELAASKAVDPYFKFNTYLNFGGEGVEIEEAYATTLDLPYSLQARAGQFLTRFGRLNPTHPHAWAFSDQPFALSRVFGGEANRGVGFELSWLTPLPWYVLVLGSAIDPRGDETSRSFLPSDTSLRHAWNLETVGRIEQFFELSHDTSLLWGLSWAGGPSSLEDGTRSDVFGTDVYLKYRPITFGSYTIVSLQSEWLYRRREQAAGAALWDVNGYAELFWRFARRWGAGARYEYGSAARAGTAVMVDPLDPDWVRARHRAALAVTFWPTEYSRLRAQIQADDPRWSDVLYSAFLTLELSTGVHGAHSF